MSRPGDGVRVYRDFWSARVVWCLYCFGGLGEDNGAEIDHPPYVEGPCENCGCEIRREEAITR